MLYSSTRGIDKDLNFTQVLLNGLAKDGGLYVPNELPFFNKKKLKELSKLDYPNLAYEITKPFIANEISKKEYKEICSKTYKNSFGKKIISINKLNEFEFISNLFHGPTYAFKDFALQLLGNIYDFVLKKKQIKLTIIGATSGDTGSAAIYGCSKSSNINMFILFPLGKLSAVQRKQMTTYNKKNVFNIAVKGNFDDCQRLVKNFFNLNYKKENIHLAAVNSINWVRIMGQIIYYFWSYFRVNLKLDPISFVVPTGNFGNAYAGYTAKKMGLPIKNIVIGSNKNDVLTRFFESGNMVLKQTQKSLSPSMDIQVSSNFERLLFDFYKNGKNIKKLFRNLETKKEFIVKNKYLKQMKSFFKSGMLNDKDTLSAIRFINKKYNIISDPHTAVGYEVGRKILANNQKRIYLATAHYGKFLNTVKRGAKSKIKYPKKLEKLFTLQESYKVIENDICQLEDFINLKNNS